ncbi:MAG TPA: M14 metallopeptidase family protein [Bryobacteraceae bacterium]|nr:M14 metallopeptidase family protein [Bryobacteraceae bacterium]
MSFRRLALFAFAAVSLFAAAVPTPTEHLGYRPGTDYKLADYTDIISYYQKLEKATPRLKLLQYGTTSSGKPMYVALISSEENIRQLDRFKEMNRRMALGLATREEAERIAKEGRVFVWIDAGMHSSEAACPQGSPELAYRMVSDESEEVRKIRDKVILVHVPVTNPDGQDLIAHWFRKNVGTPYESSALPELYQKYAGHDNNRDWFMFNLEETRHTGKLLFQEWFPQIMYNQHQAPAFPARIFVPPYAEPLNPSIPAPVMEGINLIGSAMRERFAREGKGGVLSYYGFDGWWNGGLRSTPAFHNMHGILTETAMQPYSIPREYSLSELPERFPNGIPTKQPTIFYSPWLGGKWTARDAIEYMLTADMAILNLAASMPDHWIYKAWDLANKNIKLGDTAQPFAYVVPPDQWDRWTAHEMLRRLQLGGIEVKQAKAEIRVGDRTYPAGSYVMLAGQAFRSYLVDLMEPQVYPEIRSGTTGPTKRPYDVAGWTLPLQMGVRAERINDRFDTAGLEVVTQTPEAEWRLDAKDNSSYLQLAKLLGDGQKAGWSAEGKLVTSGYAWELRKPRVAIYEPYTGNMDLGWTQWLLDTFRVPYTVLHNADVQKGGLRERFDTVLLAQQGTDSLLHGLRDSGGSGEEGNGSNPNRGRPRPRPEYVGGIGTSGLAALDAFVREGGTLVALSTAAELPLQFFPIPVRNVNRGAEGGFYSPGSLLRATVDTSHPLGFGMPKEAVVFSNGGPVMDVQGAAAKPVVNFARRDLLASGWLSGERSVLGKSILVDVTYGKGRVLLYGFRVQHRGQPFGTFKLLLNALYLGSARKL